MNDDNRDFAEEAFNRNLLDNPDPQRTITKPVSEVKVGDVVEYDTEPFAPCQYVRVTEAPEIDRAVTASNVSEWYVLVGEMVGDGEGDDHGEGGWQDGDPGELYIDLDATVEVVA